MVMAGVDSTATCVDPDGDGWGWDGTASCQVHNSNPVNPPDNNQISHNSEESAISISLNQEVFATFLATDVVSDRYIQEHYYRFEIPSDQAVSVISTGATNIYSGELVRIYPTDPNINTNLNPYTSIRTGDINERSAVQDDCLVAGTYYMSISSSFQTTDQQYSFRVNATGTQCTPLLARSDVLIPEKYSIADTGSIFEFGGAFPLRQIDLNGAILWETSYPVNLSETSSNRQIVELPNSNVLVISDENLVLLDASGELVWIGENAGSIRKILGVSNQQISVEYFNGSIGQTRLTDGALLWTHPANASFVVANSSGSIFASNSGSVTAYSACGVPCTPTITKIQDNSATYILSKNGVIYKQSNSYPSTLQEIDTSENILWQSNTQLDAGVTNVIITANRSVVVELRTIGNTDAIAMFSSAGNELWSREDRSGLTSVTDQFVYISGTRDGTDNTIYVSGLNLNTGVTEWAFSRKISFVSQTTVRPDGKVVMIDGNHFGYHIVDSPLQ